LITRLLWIAAAWLTLAGIAPATAQGGSPLLWEVTSKSTTVYLLGTIHVGNPSMYPLPPAVESAYARAQVIALEADPGDPTAMLVAMGTVMYQPPETLERNLPPALFQELRAALSPSGLPIELAQSMKPYMVSMTLTMMEAARLGFDVSLGVDLHLVNRARRDGKRIVELESMAMQLAMLDGMPKETQVAMLESTIKGMRSGSLKRDLETMIDAWRTGNAEKMDEAATREMKAMPTHVSRELQDSMFDRRNRAMADKIVQMLGGSEVVLVGVGAGHMTGSTGLVALLKARGFGVRRL
jgi:uncharacterized protein YbaP (TraB family)